MSAVGRAAGAPHSKPQPMPKIAELAPANLQEEKVKFFASGYTYNPQFTYPQPIDEQQLAQYGKPKWWLLWLSKWIVAKQEQIDKSQQKQSAHQSFLSKSEVAQIMQTHLTHYPGAAQYQVQFSTDFVSRVAVNLKHRLIKIRLPIQITTDEIEAVLAHEIDTHVLRQLNSEQQPWHGKKKKYGFSHHLRTEEGLAIINEMMVNQQQLAYRSALNYLAVDLALRADFAQVFAFLVQHVQDPERAWSWTVKKKRGLSDTSQKGGFTKDIVYFEGMLEVLQFLKRHHYDPSPLYYGKLAAQDAHLATQLNPNYQPILPLFLTERADLYRQHLKSLCANHFVW